MVRCARSVALHWFVVALHVGPVARNHGNAYLAPVWVAMDHCVVFLYSQNSARCYGAKSSSSLGLWGPFLCIYEGRAILGPPGNIQH